jgi:mRNA-degrading endonuclease RelE of RelBE toxin-antitoxin system
VPVTGGSCTIRDDEIVVLILDVKHRSKAYGGR